MELFRDANYDFLGRKKPFIVLSLVLLAAGIGSLVIKGGPKYGIDFKGGTMANIKFATKPSEDEVRRVLSSKISGEVTVQPVVGNAENELIVGTELKSETELDEARRLLVETLQANWGEPGGKPDFHAVGKERLNDLLAVPFQQAGVTLNSEQVRELTDAMLTYRDTPPRSGLIRSFDDLKAVPGVTPQILEVVKKELAVSKFAIRSFELVGPKIGRELRSQAMYATLLALGGMLVYIALRFEWIYGVAAVIAVFHDVIVTVGFFSILEKEITLTVIAALLTLVGYSMNDTIVLFDRVRENLKVMRKEKFPNLVNTSINQTLSRTVLTSGLTFLTVLSLWLFGGPVLNGFAFALVAGILVGTYSSVFIASPILLYWQGVIERRKHRGAPVSAAAAVREPPSRRGTSKAAK
jgi:preprotein translocase subunit SecF